MNLKGNGFDHAQKIQKPNTLGNFGFVRRPEVRSQRVAPLYASAAFSIEGETPEAKDDF